MCNFIKKNGFPSFECTGYYDDMRLIDGSGSFWYLWWHSRPDSTILDTVVLTAVLNGDFPPDEYAMVIDQRFNGKFISTYYTVPNDPNLSKNIDAIEQINWNREKLFLEPLEEYEKKLDYCKKDTRFIFVHNTCLGLYGLNEWKRKNGG